MAISSYYICGIINYWLFCNAAYRYIKMCVKLS